MILYIDGHKCNMRRRKQYLKHILLFFVLFFAFRFRRWLVDTPFPEETLFQTLYLSPHMAVPGAFTGHYTLHYNTLKYVD